MRAHCFVRERAGRPRTPRCAARRPRSGRRLILFLLALLAPLTIVATSFATVVQEGTLRVSITTQIKPFRLPRTDPAPISVFLAGHISSTTGGVPSQLTRMTIYVNRHGVLDTGAVPLCPVDRIRPATTDEALARCGPSLVGAGHFWASVVLPDQPAYHTTGRLLAFNGVVTHCARQAPAIHSRLLAGHLWPSRSRTQGGRQGERTDVRDPRPADRGRRDATCQRRPAVLAQIYTTLPFPSSFVVPFAITHIPHGRYGTKLSAELPEALGEWGFVNRIKMTIGRTASEGRGFLNASCPAPRGTKTAAFPLALADFSFAGGQSLHATVTKSCGVKE